MVILSQFLFVFNSLGGSLVEYRTIQPQRMTLIFSAVELIVVS